MKKSPRFWENDRERSLVRPVICRVAGCRWLFQLLLLLQLSAYNASDYLETLQQILIKLLNQYAYTEIDEGRSKYRLLQCCVS